MSESTGAGAGVRAPLDAAQVAALMVNGVTDIHVNAIAPEASVIYPGPKRVSSDMLPAVQVLLEACNRVRKDEFMVEALGRHWRGRRDALSVDGTWFRCRLVPPVAPRLDTLPTPLPAPIVELLMNGSLTQGGLIYVIGAAGSGKTTTGSSIVTSRLTRFGGCAYTVEDPPEMPLSGWHGKGFCTQAWVPGERATDWSQALRGALRSQPSNTPSMLYVGEVRDEDSARMMLRAAGNGFLVVATGFGNDIPGGIEALASLAGGDCNGILGATLRIALHTRLVQRNMVVNAVCSPSSTSSVAMAIAHGKFRTIAGDVTQQANLMREGVNPLQLVA